MRESHPLYKDIQAFKQQFEELEEHYPGKFVIFRDGEFVGAYDTFNSAANEAVERFGNEPFLIRPVSANREPMRMPASVAYRNIHSA